MRWEHELPQMSAVQRPNVPSGPSGERPKDHSMKARRGLRTFITIQFADDEFDLKVPIDGVVVPVGVKVSDMGNLDEVTVKSKTVEVEKQQ